MSNNYESFLGLSAILTGFQRVELLGTGQAQHYFDTITEILGEDVCSGLWSAAADVLRAGGSVEELEIRLRREILASPKYGPVAKNITVLWYLGRWQKMPQEWARCYSSGAHDFNHVISATAYPESLVWRAAGTHPPGAKPTGFGVWSLPPEKDGAA